MKAFRQRICDELFGSQPRRTQSISKTAELLIFETGGVTYAVSCGLAPAFDLVLSVKGKLPEKQLVAFFVQFAAGVKPKQSVLRGLTIPGFAMTCALLKDDRFSAFVGGKSQKPFFGLKPRRELFAVLPIFEGEADAIAERGLDSFADTLVRVAWDDAKRKPFAGPAPSRKAAPTGKGIWEQVLARAREVDVLEFDRLTEGKGASTAALSALKKVRPDVHASLLELLKRFDGGVSLFEYTTLSARHAALRAKSLDSLVRQKKAKFNADFTPFAEDGGGNLFCVTSRGQIVQWEIRGHQTFRRAKSMADLVAAHLKQ
ncbi:MAG: SMI1/KNR4 family protein [Archangium sp.]